MKPGHFDTATKTELGHINTVFYRFTNLKMNVHYKTTLICGQPILDCMVPYMLIPASTHRAVKPSKLMEVLGWT